MTLTEVVISSIIVILVYTLEIVILKNRRRMKK